MPPDPKVLVVDDDATLRRVLSRELTDLGFSVTTAADARDLVARVLADRPDVVLLDLKMPGVDGHQALATLHGAEPAVPVVVLTGHGSVADAVRAMQGGAYDFLQKPTRTAILEQTLRRACEHRRLGEENARLRRANSATVDPDIVGESVGMRELRTSLARVAASDDSVLILGENGTGKELIARAVHAMSPRCDESFVVVNCGAIADNLVHSELFGHAKGAFTGADRARVGLFEAAHRGTLFLDEIGDLPRELQPALLRAVQFGEIRPVGDDRTRTVDVRVVCATNRDLHVLMREGAFREDLYYRLATLELAVPALRDRSADIPLLATRFLERCAHRQGRAMVLTPAALARLQGHAWPGNVRELQNAITRLATMVGSDRIEAEHVDTFVLARARAGRQELPTLNAAELERLAIQAAMERFDGDKKRVAEAVGISLKTLYNRLAVDRAD